MDKWIAIAAVTAAATVAACTASQQSFKVQPVLSLDGKAATDSGTAEYQKGKELLSQGRFAAAAQAFQVALFADGSSVEVLNALAVSYDGLGRYDLSDRYYQRALVLDPNNPQTANNLAVSLARRGAPEIAAKVLASVQTRVPSDRTIAANLKRAQAAASVMPASGTGKPVLVETPNPPQVPRIEQMSPSTQELITLHTTRDSGQLSRASTAPPVISREAAVPEPSRAAQPQVAAVSEYAAPLAVISQTLAPPTAAAVKSPAVDKASDVPPRAGGTPAAGHREAIASAAAAASQTLLPNDQRKLALARGRLGSRIAESENIQPIDFSSQKPGDTELAMARLGVRLEVANGAGRRYMAARMRSFLDSHGFDVAHVTNAQSFDHVQTVIMYRDEYQPEALEIAKTLTTKVELVHVADLPIDVRLILGRDLLPFDHTLEKGG